MNLQKSEQIDVIDHQEHLKMSTIHLICVIILECSEIFIDIEH